MIEIPFYRGDTVLVFGMARSGLAAARALKAGGAAVLCADDGEAGRTAARAAGFEVREDAEAAIADCAALILSPGVPLTDPAPHPIVRAAAAAGVPVIGDIELFARAIAGLPQARRPRVVAITGTNGKSTTTALIGHVVKTCGLDVAVGGNIGRAALELEAPRAGLVYVLETSSFQIDLTASFAPDIAVLLNLTPDHLDRHGTMERYAAVKARLFAHQGGDATAIVGVDDRWSADIRTALAAREDGPKSVAVSVRNVLARGVFVLDGRLMDARRGPAQDVLDLNDLPALRGRHNWQNAAAAYAACVALELDPRAVAAAIRSFPGLAHRMEEVGRLGPVRFINDSKATNADAAEKALLSFERIYWIAGGKPKSDGIAPLAALFGRIAHAYLIGAAEDDFARTLEGRVPVTRSGTLERAVAAAAADAAAAGQDAAVLLSPACASFDQFRDFEHRGEVFRETVRALISKAHNAAGAAA